jgi:hypothetical protein
MTQLSDTNRRVWIALMADLSASLSAGQRRHLQETLSQLAADFDLLAGQAPATRPEAAAGGIS